MDVDSFPQEVVEALGCYVYRLIDPRNGETFYVGRGRGQRVFAHVNGDVEGADQNGDQKLERILEIRALDMDVAHIIHRHGMSEAVAKEVEAALIDAYAGLVNKVTPGKDYGTRHVKEIIAEYSAQEFVVEEPLILISIGQSWKEKDLYEAVRGLWKLRIDRAKQHKLVLAHVRGIVRGAYRPNKWLKGTVENFPSEGGELPERIGFEGTKAEPEVWQRYVGKRVPAEIQETGRSGTVPVP